MLFSQIAKIYFLFIILSYSVFSLDYVMKNTPEDVKNLITESNQINHDLTNQLCNEFTDMDFKQYKGADVSKRSKGAQRHVKHLCESFDMLHWQGLPVNEITLNNLYELRLLHRSILVKALNDDSGITCRDKIKMAMTSIVTPFIMNFKNTVWSNEAGNLNLNKEIKNYTTDELAQIDPKDSPFYKKNIETDLYARFDKSAADKKIKAKKNMVVVFDSVSDSGSAAKIRAIDAKNEDDEWSIKWGDELHSDVVGSRIFSTLGFEVDHPYYRQQDDLFLVFRKDSEIQTKEQLIKSIKKSFDIDITSYISKVGIVTEKEVAINKEMKAFLGLNYITFVECAIEARPDRVKRIGHIDGLAIANSDRRELRGSLLAHMFIDNWDTREENTLVTINNLGNRVYETRGAFSDLGTSMGVKLHLLQGDFRVGLVNEFAWDVTRKDSSRKIFFSAQFNSMVSYFKNATYSDLKWMAYKIEKLSENDLKMILKESGWPMPLQELYFHKLASRRASIIDAFDIKDSRPINFDRSIDIEFQGEIVVKNGVLVKEIELNKHPLGYLNHGGRMSNYGRK